MIDPSCRFVFVVLRIDEKVSCFVVLGSSGEPNCHFMSQDQITAYIKASDFVGEGAIGTDMISLSRIYTFVFSCCFKTHHQIRYLSAWLCKMFLSVSLPCPALIIATPSQPSIRQVRHLTFLLVHSFCNIFTLFTFLFLSYFHFHRNMIKTFASTCV